VDTAHQSHLKNNIQSNSNSKKKMAVDNSVQGSLVVLEVSIDGGSTYLEGVCESDSQIDLSNDVTTTKTKCSTFKGISAVDATISGNLVLNASPAVDEYSYNDIQTWQLQKTQLHFRYRNKSDAVVTAGEAFSFTGVGYFTQSTLTAPGDDVCKASFTFSVTDLDGDVSS
jgi:membrane peptidoglycan carboxypeptidase